MLHWSQNLPHNYHQNYSGVQKLGECTPMNDEANRNCRKKKKPSLSTDNMSREMDVTYCSVTKISAPLSELKSTGDKVFLSVPKENVPGQLSLLGAPSSLQVTWVSSRTAVLRVRAADSLSKKTKNNDTMLLNCCKLLSRHVKNRLPSKSNDVWKNMGR